jgi:hypothetical protein
MNESLSLKKLTKQIAHANPFEKGISNFQLSAPSFFMEKF